MRARSIRVLAVMACAVLVACSDPPYVHDAAAFDRDNPEFGKDRTDRDEVTICYNTRGATPADVTRLAADSCGVFGKSAVFLEQTYETCPLSHPAAAVFTCVAASTYSYPTLPQF